MRIRTIRPEFWSSEDVAALSWDARLVFIGLWSYVDDNGVGKGVERLLIAALFPLEEDLSEVSRRVHGALTELSVRGLVVLYEVDGRDYLAIPTFSLYQKPNRPTPSRYPLPTCKDAKPHDILTEPSVSPHGALTPVVVVVGEGSSRGSGGDGGSEGPPTALTVVPAPTTDSKPSRRQVLRSLPDDFAVTPSMRAWANAEKLNPDDVASQTEEFKSWVLSVDKKFADWEQGWRNSMLRGVTSGRIRKATPRPILNEWDMPRRPRGSS